MAFPTINDLILYIGTLLDGNDWNNNWQKLISFLSDGTYDLNVSKITATSYVGVPGLQINTLVAGTTILTGKFCYLNLVDGLLYNADNSASATSDTLLGVSTDDYVAGQDVVLEKNMYSGYTGLTRGIYYLGSAGGTSITAPATGIIRPVGLAINTTTMLLNINPTNSMYYGKGYTDYLSGTDLMRIQQGS